MLDSITILLFLYWALMSHHFITQSDILDCQNVRNQPVKSVVSPLNKVLGVEGHPLQTYLLVFLVLFLFFLCFFAVAKRRKRATAQQQEWDMQWVTGCAPGSPLLLYESHRAAGAPRTCHTDSHLTNRPGPSVETEASTAKEHRRGDDTSCQSHFSRPAQGSALWHHIRK